MAGGKRNPGQAIIIFIMLVFAIIICGKWTAQAIKLSTVETVRTKALCGHLDEQVILAQMYETGRMVSMDLDKARHWYYVAYTRGSRFAKARLCRIDPEYKFCKEETWQTK